jgi:murein L,D-transpeptidase YcbB/YkuD
VGDIRPYTFIRFPHVDSLRTLEQLGQRLREEKLLDSASQAHDTLILRKALLAFQHSHGLKETGRINENTVKALNNTAWEHFKTIAINLDRYKHLPDSMPERYLWVNIPSFYLKVMEADTLALLSRVVVGKPVTPTPVLSSKITNMVTYPQWNIPVSIIRKELLPNLKKNPAYLTKKGYQLVSTNGVSLNPDTIPWKRYTLNIPYRVVQPSGDDNSLGVLKFNFSNKFDVYLHDTDQRYLFRNENRSLSHGCVRVQEWQKLAHFILQTDSLSIKTPKPTYAPTDSLKAWLSRKEKRTITVKNTLPIYIRYFSCEGKEGRVRFYPDIYGVDGRIKDELFSAKTLL